MSERKREREREGEGGRTNTPGLSFDQARAVVGQAKRGGAGGVDRSGGGDGDGGGGGAGGGGGRDPDEDEISWRESISNRSNPFGDLI